MKLERKHIVRIVTLHDIITTDGLTTKEGLVFQSVDIARDFEFSMEFKILNTKYPHKPTRIVNIAVYKTRPGTGNGATLKLVLFNNNGYREYSYKKKLNRVSI
jgi:hypothetical protein